MMANKPSHKSFNPVQCVRCQYKRHTTGLQGENVRLFLSTPYSVASLLTIPTGMSLQSWLKTTELVLVGFGWFFINRLPWSEVGQSQPTFYLSSLSLWDGCENHLFSIRLALHGFF